MYEGRRQAVTSETNVFIEWNSLIPIRYTSQLRTSGCSLTIVVHSRKPFGLFVSATIQVVFKPRDQTSEIGST